MIRIIESPREGMQGFARIIPTDEKVRYINIVLNDYIGSALFHHGTFRGLQPDVRMEHGFEMSDGCCGYSVDKICHPKVKQLDKEISVFLRSERKMGRFGRIFGIRFYDWDKLHPRQSQVFVVIVF